jgi:PAS domain-containing protein
VEVLIPQELHARHVQHRANYRQHPTTRSMGSGLALEGIRKDGSRFPVEISLSPSASEEGFRVTAIIRDITERRLAEERLRRVQEESTQKAGRIQHPTGVDQSRTRTGQPVKKRIPGEYEP